MTVAFGGHEIVSSGGGASGAVIQNGGSETVSSGGIDSSARISGGEQDVYGFAGGAVLSGGQQIVEAGGTASGTSVNTDSGGGGEQDVYGLAVSTTVNGAVEKVFSGGIASATALVGSGTENISSGGTGISAVVGSGGVAVVSSGGVASGGHRIRPALVPRGWSFSGGSASGEVVLQRQHCTDDSVTVSTVVMSGGVQQVGGSVTRGSGTYSFVGGVASGTIVKGGGAGVRRLRRHRGERHDQRRDRGS